MTFLASLALNTFLVVADASAQQATPSPVKKDASSRTQFEKSSVEESEQKIDVPVPIGVPAKGIKIPYYGQDGKLQMQFEADVATKLDNTRVEMANLKIDIYDENGDKFYVEMPSSIFNLESRVLTSDSRVLIRREDFEIIGDAGEFLLKPRFGKLNGNIKMTIFSTEKFQTP